MTRLIKHLNENSNVELLDEVTEKLKSDCSIYLNDIKRQYNILLSGRKSKEKFFERDVRKNRTPMDTPIEIHNIFDNHFQKKTGIRLRSSSLFCVSGRNTAGAYGNVYYIFPIGKYQTWYNPDIVDLYGHFNIFSVQKKLGLKINAPFPLKQVVVKIKEDYEYEKFFNGFTKELVSGYKQGTPESKSIEIMLYCDKYFALNYNWAEYAMRIKLGISFDEWLLERK